VLLEITISSRSRSPQPFDRNIRSSRSIDSESSDSNDDSGNGATMENRFDQGYLECYVIGFAGSFRGTAVAATGSGQPIRVMQLVKLSWRRRAATAIDAVRSPRARARARCRGLRVSLLPKFSDTTTAGNPGTTGCQCAIGENVTCAQRCNLEIEPSFSIASLLVLALVSL